MRTRSQTKYVSFTYEETIDFDAASNAWKANKVSKGNGTYTYACYGIKRDGHKCSLPVCGRTDFCRRHKNI
jgi:hypothetical protein